MNRLKELTLEIKRRQGTLFNVKNYCYPKQFDFVSDPNPYATAVTSRRAGKTVGCAADLLSTALTYPHSTSLYITLTRVNAKILLWPIIKKINEEYHINAEPNESDLSLKFKNGSVIYLSGAKDVKEIEKFRGMALKKVYLDEAQSMKSYIETLIDDILDPACIDHDGLMRVIGTPGPVPVGYFHKVSTSPGWAHHNFTIWDNPFIKNAKKRLELVLKRRGVTIDHPSIQREYFGRWVLDLEALVIQYNAERNHFEQLPDGHKWEHVIAVDLGYEDSDAIGVIAFSETSPSAYLVYEETKAKQGITELAIKLDQLIKTYPPLKLVMDTGGLGKKVAEEMRKRFALPIEAAEKTRKFEFIELLNDALRTGRFRAKRTSLFAQDAMLLEWDREQPQKPKVSESFHSDIIDAVLYGFRESLHWLHEPRQPKPIRGSLEDFDEQEKKIWESVEAGFAQTREEESFWDDFD